MFFVWISVGVGTGAGGLEFRVKRALERITGKLGAILLKQGKPRDALQPCAESLVRSMFLYSPLIDLHVRLSFCLLSFLFVFVSLPPPPFLFIF